MKVKNIGKTDEYVYDINLDGTVVDALSLSVMSNTDGFDFKLPNKFRYTKETGPYIGKGLNRESKKDKEYYECFADVAEFCDTFLDKTYNGSVSNKSGLGIDEFVKASLNLSRKNYLCWMAEDDSIKKVGNTVKSRKLAMYLQKFINKACDLLIQGDGTGFLNSYYDMIDDIYNYRISVKDIASKGNVKQSLADYKEACKTITKSGSKKSRQAWYELAIQNNLNVSMGDSIYYVNTGAKKGDTDVKRVTHQFIMNPDNPSEEVELVTRLQTRILKEECMKEGIEYKTLKSKDKKDRMKKYIVREEDEIFLNCKMVPIEILESDRDIMCSEVPELEYNVEKYIEQFNSRIKPLLVCFSTDIREQIIITNPSDRPMWTNEQTKLVSDQPNKPGDQDTYEALMTPERKEIAFWLSVNEVPPYIKECGMDWDKMVTEYKEILKKEQDELFQQEDKKYLSALESLKKEDIDLLYEDGTIPASILEIVTLNADDMRFYFKAIPDMTPSTGGYMFDDISIDNMIEVEGVSNDEQAYAFVDANDDEKK